MDNYVRYKGHIKSGLFYSYFDRAVVRAEYVVEDLYIFDLLHHLWRGEEVVYPPTDIAISGEALHIPVSVGSGLFGIEVSIDIYPAFGNEFVHPSSLFRKEADVSAVFFRPSQVNLLMSNVNVATKDYIRANSA